MISLRTAALPFLAIALVATLCVPAPNKALADHKDYTESHRLPDLDRYRSRPYAANNFGQAWEYYPPWRNRPDWTLSHAEHGGTGSDGYWYTDKTQYDNVWYRFYDYNERKYHLDPGKYKIRWFAPRPSRFLGRGATVPPTAERALHKVWQKELVQKEVGDYTVSVPEGDWYVKYEFYSYPVGDYNSGGGWRCHCDDRYELWGDTVIQIDLEDSSSGIVNFDRYEIEHEALTQNQVEAIKEVAGEIPTSECRSWIEKAINALISVLVGIIASVATAALASNPVGWTVLVAIAAATSTATYIVSESFEVALSRTIYQYFEDHFC